MAKTPLALTFVALATLGVALYAAPAATPSRPHVPGIYLVESDGSNLRWLTRGRLPRWSPDGTQVFFQRGEEVWVVPARGGSPRRLSQHGGDPRCSPKGNLLAYSEERKTDELQVHVLDLASGLDRELCDGYQPSWSPAGDSIVCATKRPDDIFCLRQVNVKTGRYQDIFGPAGGDENVLGIYEPLYSRLGDALYFVLMSEDSSIIKRLPVGSREESTFVQPPAVIRAETSPGDEYEAGFDTGSAYYGIAQAGLTESAKGTHFALEEWSAPWSEVRLPSRIVVISSTGDRKCFFEGTCPTWSPTGTRLAYDWQAKGNPGPSIYVVSSDGTGARKLVPGQSPQWSPVGDSIAFEYAQAPKPKQAGKRR